MTDKRLEETEWGEKKGQNTNQGGKEKWDKEGGQKGPDKGRRALTSYHGKEYLLLHCA